MKLKESLEKSIEYHSEPREMVFPIHEPNYNRLKDMGMIEERTNGLYYNGLRVLVYGEFKGMI